MMGPPARLLSACRWAAEQGLQSRLVPARFDGLRGLTPEADLEAGDTALSLPEGLLISESTARASDLVSDLLLHRLPRLAPWLAPGGPLGVFLTRAACMSVQLHLEAIKERLPLFSSVIPERSCPAGCCTDQPPICCLMLQGPVLAQFDLAPDMLTVMYTMYERHQPDSPHSIFWQTLPAHFGTALSMAQQAVDLLQGIPAFAEVTAAREVSRHEYTLSADYALRKPGRSAWKQCWQEGGIGFRV